MKRILSVTMMVAAFTVAIVSCKDDFNEEDISLLRAELRSKADADKRARDSANVNFAVQQEVESYIAALNEAGDLLAVTFLLRENGEPVEGVTVTLTSGTSTEHSAGRAKAELVGQTDASGNVTFERVIIGKGTVSFVKTGFISTTAVVDFGAPGNPVPITISTASGSTATRYAPPPKRYESGTVSMFSADATNEHTAVIEGTVTIETDVTNLTPEVPAGAIIRANLTNLLPNIPGFMSDFAFIDDSSLGVATIQANGAYSMRVPATANGANSINLIIPNIEGTRRTAVNGYDNGTGSAVALPNGPEYRDVPVVWGPQAPLSKTNIPVVVGAKVVFPEPPPAGTGLAFSATPVARPLPLSAITSTTVDPASVDLFGRITNRGNYGSSLVRPVVGFSHGGGTGATATAILRTFLSSVTVTNPGSGYGPLILLTIRGTFQDGTTVNFSSRNVASVSGGLPPVIDLNNLDCVDCGFGVDDTPIPLNGVGHQNLVSVALVVAAPPAGPGAQTGQVTATFVTELASIQITDGGTNYVSPPTIQLTGGGAGAVQAQVEIVQLNVFWILEPDNAASQNYLVRPNDFTVRYPSTGFGTTPGDETTVNLVNPGGFVEGLVPSEIDANLTAQNGQIVRLNPYHRLRSVTKWGVSPVVLIDPNEPVRARATISAANISLADGSITASPAAANVGEGYATSPVTATIQPSITGAPGAGASLALTNSYSPASREYQWNGISIITNAGSGYLRNLNQKPEQTASLNATVNNIQAGKTYKVNLAYGTGSAIVPIN